MLHYLCVVPSAFVHPFLPGLLVLFWNSPHHHFFQSTSFMDITITITTTTPFVFPSDELLNSEQQQQKKKRAENTHIHIHTHRHKQRAMSVSPTLHSTETLRVYAPQPHSLLSTPASPASPASNASLALFNSKQPAMVPSGRGDGALTSPTLSTFSSPSTSALVTNTYAVDENTEVILRPPDQLQGLKGPSPSQMNQPQRRVRQWTPRRRSPLSSCSNNSSARGAAGDGGTVTTVRDWVRSTRCSPSKEPRSSSSLSRRDGFVVSFASALVPRSGGEELSDVLWSRTTTTSGTTTRSESVAADSVGGGDREDWDAAQVTRHQRLHSPQRAASWRQLRSHPGGASSRVSPPLTSSSVQSSSLLRRDEFGGPCHDDNATTISLVSSPSVMTPLTSRATSPVVSGPPPDTHHYHHHNNSSSESSERRLSSHAPSAAPPVVISARELERMQEWQSTTAAQYHEQEQQQQQHCCNDQNPSFGASAQLPPTAPRASRQDRSLSGRLWSGNGPRSARSDSLSRASAYTSAVWSDQHGSAAPTSLGWQSGSSIGNQWNAGGGAAPLSSTASSRCLSPTSLSPGWSGRNGRGVGDSYSSSGGGRGLWRGGMSLDGSCTTISLSPTSPAFSLPLPSSSSFLDVVNGGRSRFDVDDAVDARTMEDIEDANTKRKCVESPTTSPVLASLSRSLSLAEALAAQPSRIAVPSEAHLWEQRERRRRAASPSLARPEEEDVSNAGDHGVARCVRCSDDHHTSLQGGHLLKRSDPLCHPLRSVGQHQHVGSAAPAGSMRDSNEGFQLCDQDHSPSLAPLREATVAPSAAARARGVGGVGGVVEVGSEEEEGGGIAGRAASLSFCSASEDEPEVDTFALERAQAVMEDADAEAVSALLAHQHRLHVHATSDFAQDLRAHGAHVDPTMWEAEETRARDEEESSGNGTDLSCTCQSLETNTGGTPTPISTPTHHMLCSPMSPPPVPPTAAATSTLAVPSSSLSSPFTVASPRRTSSTTTAAPSSSSPPPSRVSGDECLLRTPPRPKRPTQHLRWSGPEENEGLHTPCSATTVSSHSLRDVSPPLRERSMAPAELRKEKEV